MATTKQPATIQALQIIRDNWITSPEQFGRLMWPDHDAWRGTKARKRAIKMSAGAFLGKLRARGLVHGYAHIYVTVPGQDMLRAALDADGRR